MTSLLEALHDHGIVDPATMLAACRLAGLDPAAGAVVLMDESSGGHMVWGHDHVVTGGAYTPGGPVTRENVEKYLHLLSGGHIGRQGCGACQLTGKDYQDRGAALGGMWDPLANMRAGFEGLAHLIKKYGVQQGFRRYNGSGPDAEKYGRKSAASYTTWSRIVANAGGAPVSTTKAAPAAPAPVATGRPRAIGTDLMDAVRFTGQGCYRLVFDPIGASVVSAGWVSFAIDTGNLPPEHAHGLTAAAVCYPQRPGGGTAPPQTFHPTMLPTNTSSRDVLALAPGTDQVEIQYAVPDGCELVMVPAFRAAA